MITPMATEKLADDAPRVVGVVIRMQLPLNDALRSRVADEHASLNGYLERLVRRDLGDCGSRAFVAVLSPTFAAKGKNGTGRPTKGARKAVKLRVEPALRKQIHQRAESLQLTINDYLESLVSHDISAATTAGEAMPLDQTG